MPLAQEDFDTIGEYVRRHIGEWLESQCFARPPQVYEIELRERMVRVEEELKNQRELMKQGFEQIDKRFEQIDRRFEQVEKRFEQFDQRFEQMNLRLEKFMRWSFGLTLTVGGLVVAFIKYL